MHTSLLILVYAHNELLHVTENHMVTFRDTKYNGQINKYKKKS